MVSLVDEQQGTSKSTSSESFGTFDEVIQVDPSYKPSSDKTDGMPLSWANGNWISLKLFKFVFHIFMHIRTGDEFLQLNRNQSFKTLSSFDFEKLMEAIDRVEKKIDTVQSKVIGKIDSVALKMEESFKNDLPLRATQHADYHRWIVESNFGSVSCDSVDKLVATNTALSEKTIAISMVSTFFNSIMDIYFILYYCFPPQVFFISERYKSSKIN